MASKPRSGSVGPPIWTAAGGVIDSNSVEAAVAGVESVAAGVESLPTGADPAGGGADPAGRGGGAVDPVGDPVGPAGGGGTASGGAAACPAGGGGTASGGAPAGPAGGGGTASGGAAACPAGGGGTARGWGPPWTVTVGSGSRGTVTGSSPSNADRSAAMSARRCSSPTGAGSPGRDRLMPSTVANSRSTRSRRTGKRPSRSAARRSSAACAVSRTAVRPIIRAEPLTVWASRNSAERTCREAVPVSSRSRPADNEASLSSTSARNVASSSGSSAQPPIGASGNAELRDRRPQFGREHVQLSRGRSRLLRPDDVLTRDVRDLHHRRHHLVGGRPLLLGGDGDFLCRCGCFVHHAGDAFEGLDDAARQFRSGMHLLRPFFGGENGGVRLGLNFAHDALDFCRGFLGTLRELAHFGGDDRETAPVLPRTGGLNRGVEGEEVGLIGQVVDDLENPPDLLGFLAERQGPARDGVDPVGDGVHRSDGGGHRLPALLGVPQGLGGVPGDRFGGLGDLRCGGGEFLDGAGRLSHR